MLFAWTSHYTSIIHTISCFFSFGLLELFCKPFYSSPHSYVSEFSTTVSNLMNLMLFTQVTLMETVPNLYKQCGSDF